MPVDVTAYLAPYAPRRVRRPVLIALTEHTYPLEASPEQSWLPIAFRAFARLAEPRSAPVRDLLIVGSGNGLDALGAADIFELRSMAITDLFDASVTTISDNVHANLADLRNLEISFHAGDLLSCVPQKRRFDLIYENLPNIPASAEMGAELRQGATAGWFFDASRSRDVPPTFEDYRLALHYQCLRDAHEHLREGGGVLTAIGGRMPDEVAFGLHTACGYVPDLIAFDVKPQVAPEVVLPGYRQAEAQAGVQFRYNAAEAVDLVAETRLSGLEGVQLKEALDGRLADLSMSATEAERLTQRGHAVAHFVLMIVGRESCATPTTDT